LSNNTSPSVSTLRRRDNISLVSLETAWDTDLISTRRQALKEAWQVGAANL
jgi:hypothetical protein